MYSSDTEILDKRVAVLDQTGGDGGMGMLLKLPAAVLSDWVGSSKQMPNADPPNPRGQERGIGSTHVGYVLPLRAQINRGDGENPEVNEGRVRVVDEEVGQQLQRHQPQVSEDESASVFNRRPSRAHTNTYCTWNL